MTVAKNKHVQLGAPARSRARNRPFPVSDLLKVRRRISHRLSVSADPPLGRKPRRVDDAGLPLISSGTSDIDMVVAILKLECDLCFRRGEGPQESVSILCHCLGLSDDGISPALAKNVRTAVRTSCTRPTKRCPPVL